MSKFTVKTKQEVEVSAIIASVNVRYWEDAIINGKEDSDGTLTPLRDGDLWVAEIDLETGIIRKWPLGTTAKIHFKICDEGAYRLINNNGETVKGFSGYVPSIMCPGDEGDGDYIIMNIDENGKIADWHVDLSAFEEEEE